MGKFIDMADQVLDQKQKQDQSQNQDTTLMHNFDTPNTTGAFYKIVILLVVVVLLGVGTGFLLARNNGKVGSLNVGSITSGSNVQTGKTYGSNDTATFKDTAEGVVKTGGIDGEGQFHLVRTGGDSQNVYMTSSILDLSLFTNRKVKVWGQTQQAKTAGWLMDVGRVQVE